MKRILAFTLAALTAVSFSACGKKKTEDKAQGSTDAPAQDVSVNVPEAPAEYLEYVLLEKSDIAKTLANSIDNYKKAGGNTASVGDIDISLGSGTKGFLTAIDSEAGAMYDQLTWFRNATISYDAVINNNDLMSIAAKLGINDSHILSMNVVAALGQNAVFVNVPELSAQTIMADLGEYLRVSSIELNPYVDYLPEGAAAERMVNKFTDVVLAELDDIKKEDDSVITVNGISQNVTKLEITIDSETAVDISKAVITAAMNDKDVENIITAVSEKNYTGAGYDSSEEMKKSAYDTLSGTLEDLENGSNDSEDILSISIYTNDDHNITSLEADFNDEEVATWHYAENAGKCAFLLSVDGNAMIQGNGTVENEVIDAKANIYGTDAQLIGSFELRGMNLAAIENGMLNGTVAIKLSEDFTADIELPEVLSTCELVMDFRQSTKESSEVTVTLNHNGHKVAALKVTGTEKQAGKIAVPENALNISDEGAAESYSASMSFDTIIDNLSKAGASKLLSLILGF